MARRVLGDDPFADPKGEEPAKAPDRVEKKVRTQPVEKARVVKGKPSQPPKPRRSRAPAKGDEPAADVVIPPAAKVPVVDESPAGDEVAASEPAADDEGPLSVAPPFEESFGAADLPPDVARAAAESLSVPPPAPSSDAADETLEESIRDLEARLDRLIKATREGDTRRAEPLMHRVADRIRAAATPEAARADGGAERDEPAAFDTAKELLSSDFYRRQWGRVAMRDRSEEFDEFGYDPDHDARWRPVFDFLYERWWRVEVSGIENVPSDGRVALVANHSGAVPYDGVMLAAALRREHPAHRQLRWLAEDFVSLLPFVGPFLTRLGAVRACPENAERLLRQQRCVAMFPEGVKGAAKPFRERYKLQRFGRGGHIKLAIRTRTPVVPVAIVGAEETHPLVAPTGLLSRLFGVPYVPVTPTFPLLGPLGLVPLPSKWKIVFGEAIPMDGYSPDAADDDVLVGRLNEKVRGIIQDTLERALRERKSVFRG